MATTTKKATTTKVKEETKEVKVETKKVEKNIEKKYVILTTAAYPMQVSKEQYEEIKQSSNIVESETDDTIFVRVEK